MRRLRWFQRVTLMLGQKQTVTFTLDASDFGGEIDVYAGDSSTATLEQPFTHDRLNPEPREGVGARPPLSARARARLSRSLS